MSAESPTATRFERLVVCDKLPRPMATLFAPVLLILPLFKPQLVFPFVPRYPELILFILKSNAWLSVVPIKLPGRDVARLPFVSQAPLSLLSADKKAIQLNVKLFQ